MKELYFKSLKDLLNKFNTDGVKEVKTIALVYQVAFKILEAQSTLTYPIQYKYTAIDINKKVIDKHINDVYKCSAMLLQVIQEEEAFADLVTAFVEELDVTNKNIAQFFTPSDVACALAELSLITTTVDEFEQVKYVEIGDPTGCGAGSLVLAPLRAMSKIDGFKDHHYQSVSVYMCDLDGDLHRIAFFQVLLSSLLHAKPIGRLEVENKNIISEYTKQTDSLLFIANMQREFRVISLKREKEKDELSAMASVN